MASTPLLESIPVQEAVGSVLFHDITRIIPGQEKGPVFRKGHIITEEDIPVLLSVGKENIYVCRQMDGILHENDAAKRIADCVAGDNLTLSEPKEGRINFISQVHGLLTVDVPALTFVNTLGDISLATMHTNQEVMQGQAVAGTRIIPLVIEEEKIMRLEQGVKKPIVQVLPFRSYHVGIVTTGSEVYYHRIEDGFGPVLRKKFAQYGCSVFGQVFTDDTTEMTEKAIHTFAEQGADMIVCTGGMSVDPDDRTPLAIRRACGGNVVSYGAPTFPGAMFMLAWMEYKGTRIPVMGLPGCVMYHKASIFELILPRILAGVSVSAEDIAVLGHGGFCSGCAECHFPICPFGKY